MRLLVESDWHAHHRAGLNAPDFWFPTTGIYGKWGKVNRELWNKRLEMLDKIGPVDVWVLNGDAMDGRGEKSGGTELLPDPAWQNQIANAEACARAVEFKGEPRRFLTRGTPYHSGASSDYEDTLAANLGATIKDHVFLEIGGVTLDFKHKVGSSSIPHGRATPIARERLWNLLWSEHAEQPKADILIRSHIHYFTYTGGSDWLALTTPALQAAGTKYGGRQCSGTVDFGVVVFDCEGGEYDWKPYIARVKANKVEAIKL